MRLTKGQLKQIIREEYSRLQRRRLIREFGIASGADFAEFEGAGEVEQAVQGILGDCRLVGQGGKVDSIYKSRDGFVVEVDSWLYQNDFIDDIYGAVEDPFVEDVLVAVEQAGQAAGMSISGSLSYNDF